MWQLPLLDDVVEALTRLDEGVPGAKRRVWELRARLATESAGAEGAEERALKTYPSVDDPDFHRKLQRLRDFYANVDGAAVARAAGARLDGRQLMAHQRFVARYLSPGTGYNGLLVAHGVGFGKTCTAVHVMSAFRGVMDKPALVLTRSSIWPEFLAAAGDISTARYDEAASGWRFPTSCMASRMRAAAQGFGADERAAASAAVAHARTDAFELMGYNQFANAADREADLPRRFSNRVVVVDEAHNLRDGAEEKESYARLMAVLREASNVKLLLLTATPVYDGAREIVPLLNLLRVNDGRSEVDADAVFDGRGALVDEAALRNAARGYVSVAYGKSDRYPDVLTPSVATGSKPDPWPADDPDPPPDPAAVELATCELAPDHAALLPAPDDGGDASATTYSQDSMLFYGGETGEAAVRAVLASETTRGIRTYAYRSGAPPLFSAPLLKRHAPKLARVVDAALECDGVVMAYTTWLGAGAVPLALALEHAGLRPYGRAPLLPEVGRDTEARGSYVIISGASDLNPDVPGSIAAARAPSNADGSAIKVLVCTSKVSEGVTFKNVREVHVLDPWWNLTRLDQVVGRAVRYDSHADLPPEKRNVTVFYHAATGPGGSAKLDHWVYGIAMTKDLHAARVMRLLAEEAVDCPWRLDGRTSVAASAEKEALTSRGIRVTLPPARAGSRQCLYGDCARTCKHDHLLSAVADAASELYAPSDNDEELVFAVARTLLARASGVTLATLTAACEPLPRDAVERSLTTPSEGRERTFVAGKRGAIRLTATGWVVFEPEVKRPRAAARVKASSDEPTDAGVAAFAPDGEDIARNVGLDESYADFAADMVVARLPLAALLETAAARERPDLAASMKRLGVLSADGSAVSYDGVVYEVATGKPLRASAAKESSPAAGSADALDRDRAYLEEGALYIRTTGTSTGRRCATLLKSDIAALLEKHGAPVSEEELSTFDKRALCVRLELVLRERGLVGRTPV